MFPNVRLMIVAVFASIMGIGCALGLFAEFRVSHDSFLRESNAGAPLQLGFNNLTPAAAVSTAATFGLHLHAGTLSLGGEDAEKATATEPGAEIGRAQPDAAPAVSPAEPATMPSTAANAPEMPPVIGSVAEPAPPASSATASEAPSPATMGVATDRDGHQQGAKQDAAGAVAAQTPADSLPKPTTAPQSEIAPETTKSSEPNKSAKAPLRHRLTKVRRFRRPQSVARAQPIGQNSAAGQSGYQWTSQSGVQSPQPVRRRVLIKRVRPARKTVGESERPRTTAAANSTPDPSDQR